MRCSYHNPKGLGCQEPAERRLVWSTQIRVGWKVTTERDYCAPHCAEEERRLTRQRQPFTVHGVDPVTELVDA